MMCYRGRTMAAKRAGTTVKVSISLERAHLAVLQRRAKEAHDGNLSAAIAELTENERIRQARVRVIELLGLPPSTEAGLAAIAAELDAAPQVAARPTRASRRRTA